MHACIRAPTTVLYNSFFGMFGFSAACQVLVATTAVRLQVPAQHSSVRGTRAAGAMAYQQQDEQLGMTVESMKTETEWMAGTLTAQPGTIYPKPPMKLSAASDEVTMASLRDALATHELRTRALSP